ncbi:MAG: bifunctional glutamate N-acetyltransferase/amino-acid acetyltransferase ArgJ [Defluviitaleaceae bacterium]|nr:bifunctional glutamate N-acetyltransferase/amino-acid acetyltransferase ArgJ [Defluviitaleaceae bacterium]
MTNIASPKGFTANGAHVGVKKARRDLTLIASEIPAAAAGCFTRNIVKAAPVVFDEQIIKNSGKARGIVINSGNANACTGGQGMDDARAMASAFAGLLGAAAEEVFVCSTGVIGVPLPMDKIAAGIPETYKGMGNAESHGLAAVEGIMTTDTFAKTAGAAVTLGGVEVKLAGMAKGSGMIHPNMATMLAFVTTDAAISAALLQKALTDAVGVTFNMISVDGDTSTNDTILALANGMAGNPEIAGEGPDYAIFAEALRQVCESLAVDVARDGEGATKLFEVRVSGAASEDDARTIARAVTSSSLVKTAIFGADANMGRALCAMGYSGGNFDPAKVSVSFSSAAGRVEWMKDGNVASIDEDLAKRVLSEKELVIDIGLADGNFSAKAWGCDLTYEYVKINGDYRS